MGVVYQAEQQSLQRSVAVKVFPAEAQYHLLSLSKGAVPRVLDPKYSSTTIRPSLRMMNARVLLESKKSIRLESSAVFQFSMEASVVSHSSESLGGKYNAGSGGNGVCCCSSSSQPRKLSSTSSPKNDLIKEQVKS